MYLTTNVIKPFVPALKGLKSQLLDCLQLHRLANIRKKCQRGHNINLKSCRQQNTNIRTHEFNMMILLRLNFTEDDFVNDEISPPESG